MKYEFTSGFAPQIKQYLQFRKGIGYGNEHERHLSRFDMYCTKHYPHQTELTKEVVRGWFYDEIMQGRRSLEYKASAIRMFAQYLGTSSYVLPTKYIPKTPQFLPYILTDEELTAFFNAVDNFKHSRDPFLQIVMPVLLRLIYSCGLRPGEARNMCLTDINLNTGEIFIRKSKKNADRVVVTSNDMLMLLKRYSLKRMMLASDSEYLFVHTDSSYITYMELWKYVRKYWAIANFDKKDFPPLRPYDLRHRFASTVIQNWLDEGKDIYAMLPFLRAYMGHVRFEETLYYVHLLPDRLIKSSAVNWAAIDKIRLGEEIWDNN